MRAIRFLKYFTLPEFQKTSNENQIENGIWTVFKKNFTCRFLVDLDLLENQIESINHKNTFDYFT